MATFLSGFALSYAAALLLVGGVGHAIRPGHFVRVIRGHGLFRSRPAASLVVTAVCGLELVVGGAAGMLLFGGTGGARQTAVLVAAACAGGAFAAYLRRVLAGGVERTSCGCSPLDALLTRASLAPSLGLGLVSCLGLLATALASADGGDSLSGVVRALPALWGVTLSGLTMVYPAAVWHP